MPRGGRIDRASLYVAVPPSGPSKDHACVFDYCEPHSDVDAEGRSQP
jgi:hypothetical protein